MADHPHHKLPEGRLSRLSKMAQVGLRTGAGLLMRDGEGSAKQAAAVLGQLRGLAAKLGQMAGYVDGIIPEEHRDAYERALTSLQAAAPRSDPAEVRHFVEEQLGAPLDRLFSAWDEHPVASASIGQVHRAVLPDELGGHEVAVKVQHPGIVKALSSDLRNASALEGMMGVLGGRRLNSAEVLQAVRDRFHEELDYALEADRMDFFRALSAHDPAVRVPRVVRERSSGRVLSSEFVRGLGFAEACASPEPTRHRWAETLWRFIFRGNLVAGQFNADPHPGNYFFHDDGVITFLDFGCVNPMGPGQVRLAHAIHHAAISDDVPRFREATRVHMPTRAGRLEKPSIDYIQHAFLPLLQKPFRVTREYAASLVEGMKHLAKVALTTPKDELYQMPPEMIFMNRLQFGFYSVLARLDVEVDYAAVERGFWPEVVERHGVPPLP